MTLPPFAYARPTTLDEALGLLREDGARPLAGGQSLVPALAARVGERPRMLVDLAALPGLDAIAMDAGGRLRIGALVRQRTAERSPLVAEHAPLLSQALAHVGHPATRNRGTVVGSLLHADPAAEVPAVAVALDGVVVVAGASGMRRELPAAELLAGPQRTTLAPGELAVELLLPAAAAGEGHAWLEFAPRRFDLPLVGAAAHVALDGRARLTFAGVGAVPISAFPLSLSDSGNAEVALERAVAALDPPSDARASTVLRRRLARTLGLRALAAAEAAVRAEASHA